MATGKGVGSIDVDNDCFLFGNRAFEFGDADVWVIASENGEGGQGDGAECCEQFLHGWFRLEGAKNDSLPTMADCIMKNLQTTGVIRRQK